MQITLHWWIVPIILALLGLFFAYRFEKESSGYGFDIVSFALMAAFFGGALCFVAGHYI